LNEICDTNIKATPLHFACLSNNLPAVVLLCRKNAIVNSKDYLGNTPLTYAVENDNVEIIRVLDEHGGDANIKNLEGLDPYSIAFYNEKNNARKFFLGNINYRMRNFNNNISI
jgi:ankyrin repeat protein